jgi:hypothetical protein
MQILSRLRGLVAPTTPDQPLRLADGSGGGGGGGGGGSPLTTKGDLFGFDTAGDRVPVGTDGQVLTADSTAALGVSYQSAGSPLDMDDGVTTVNNVTLINITGGSLSSPSAGVADLAIAGGGGGTAVALTLSGGSTTLTPATASLYLLTLTANSSISLGAATAGLDEEMQLLIIQSGGAAHTITWPSNIGWPGGTAPVLTTTVGNADLIRLVCGNGFSWYGFLEAADIVPPAPPPSGYDAVVLADAPAAYFKMAEISGTTAADSGPNSLTAGTYGSGATTGNPPIASGLADSALMSGGSNTYLDVPHNSVIDFTSGDFSVECWVILTTNTGNQQFICLFDGSNGYRLILIGGTFAFFTPSRMVTSTTSPVLGTTYHLVVTFNHTTGVYKIYVNGALEATSSTGQTNPALTSGADLFIGNLPPGIANVPWIGSMSNLALYGSELLLARVAAHYAAGI